MSDTANLPEHRRREGYRIVISAGLWRDYDVTVEPPTSTHALRHFASHPDAMAHAELLAIVEGWPIKDQSEEPA